MDRFETGQEDKMTYEECGKGKGIGAEDGNIPIALEVYHTLLLLVLEVIASKVGTNRTSIV